MKAGIVMVVRDGFVVDSIRPFENEEEYGKAVQEADREIEYNRHNYQGTWRRGVVMGKGKAVKGLGSYCRAIGF